MNALNSDLKLISLLSSATEIVHALGLGHLQVGRSHECDFPPAVEALPICSRPNISVDVSSREIDSSVNQRSAAALSIYDLDAELIQNLQPTHIFTQTQCKVCAVSLDDVEQALRQVKTAPRVVSLEPHALADVWEDIRRVATSCQCEAMGERLIECLKTRMRGITQTAAQSASRPTVATIEWLDPLMVAGNWIPELIEQANGTNLFGVAGGHSPYIGWDEIVAADPDVIVAFPCGFGLERTRGEMHWLTDCVGWKDLRAVRDGRAFYCDGNQFMNRPGPRLVESLQIFAEILHPGVFAPALEGVGWARC